ncbi:CDP-alcohol phosphatidyltransferase family protein [Sphingomonas sp. LY29]|uniref:CDP-alcohol phosphatidyltransferase family protein n=1 Tax=Sphingomonas sp. LY29 TaxID=3095341 RepID=UPI002D79DFA2|nr:CDP-alcohol phosphatidyltransferase family protein [Sphingomonas sp. LY29]WRP27093.1 CDP-alcohol phosphatidyltransferase family protein [Sphingomonas sp. LY29]
MNRQDRPLPDVKPITRIQENLVARVERRLLTWLCARLPAWVTPDQLTSLGLVGAAMVFVGYGLSTVDIGWLGLAIAGFFVHWFGDSLDGSLARFRSIERPRFGYFIDHSADGLGNLMIVGGLGISPFVRLDVALLALAGYYLLSIHAFLSARIIGELRLSYVAAGPTELRLLLIAMTVLMFVLGRDTTPPLFNGFDIFVGVVAAIMITIFVVQTISVARLILRQGE